MHDVIPLLLFIVGLLFWPVAGLVILTIILQRSSKRARILIISIIVALLLITVLPAFRSEEGYLLDAETGKPLEGVVVAVEYISNYWIGNGPYVAAQETLTDQNGYFFIRQKWWSHNPWAVAWNREFVSIFKHGYKPFYHDDWMNLLLLPNVKLEKGKYYIPLEKPDSDFDWRLQTFNHMSDIANRWNELKYLREEIQEEKKTMLELCKKASKGCGALQHS